MRMNQKSSLTAHTVISEYSFDQLKEIFSRYGEIRNSKKLAGMLVDVRSGQEILTTSKLNEVLENVIVGDRNKYLAQVYQALRIEVNQEIQSLEDLLRDSLKVLKNDACLLYTSPSPRDRG